MLDILFIVPTDKLKLKNEVNGTMILATKLLQDGFSVEILRFAQMKTFAEGKYQSFIEEIANCIQSKNPKCVSFYTLWPCYHIMLRIATEIKKRNPGIITVFGGPQASATAQETLFAMSQVDYICPGEGENTAVPFFRALFSDDQGGLDEIPQLWDRHGGQVRHNPSVLPLCGLNDLPYWDKRLYSDVLKGETYDADRYFMPIDVGRGCPYNCTFCSTKDIWNRTYRLKSPERIVEEICYYRNQFGIHSFWFTHDAFTANQKLVDAVCDKILEEKLEIRWICTTRVDCISKELILKMKQAGLVGIELGIESGSHRMQKIINKQLNLSSAREMTDFLLKSGLKVNLFFMYGFPEETEQDLNETMELLFDLTDQGARHDTMAFCRFNPKTAITEQYYDALVLDSSVSVLFRNDFGLNEELEMIRENKALFTHYYHLPTPLRNQYQYMLIFARLYQDLHMTMSRLREIYNGNNLQFYHAFKHSNEDILQKSISFAVKVLVESPWEYVQNILQHLDSQYMPYLRSILQYECDVCRIRSSLENVAHRKTYSFSYMDIMRKRPLNQFAQAKTTLEMKKDAGTFRVRVVDIE